ncbi:MAG: FecR family protein [Myxococcales bacterium]|nr:FecR family protein [Myxococcales bacterium]
MIASLIAMTVSLVEGPVTPKLAQGAEVHAGDTIETGEGGRVEITMPGGTILRLGESSRITLHEDVPQKAFSARLLLGNVWAKVHKLIAGETFQIETENAVAGVRGTEFRVEVAPQQEDLVRVYEGVVQVDGEGGKWSHRVEAAHELRFRRDRQPDGPRSFDPDSEKGHRFMEWVRTRHEDRDPAREQRRREKHRERRQRDR